MQDGLTATFSLMGGESYVGRTISSMIIKEIYASPAAFSMIAEVICVAQTIYSMTPRASSVGPETPTMILEAICATPEHHQRMTTGLRRMMSSNRQWVVVTVD